MSEIFKFALGDEVKDRITGFKGVIVTRIEWFNGCVRYNVQPQKLDKDKLHEPQPFDQQQLDLVKSQKVARESRPMPTQAHHVSPPGGPHDDAKSPVKTTRR